MIANTPYLFVYSSLRKGFQQSAYDYLRRYFTFIGDAKVKGVLYDLGDQPVGTPTEEERYIVGELYKLNIENGSFAFGQLDDYEGVNPEEGHSALFRRETGEVMADDGFVTKAWIYWYNGDVSGKPMIECGDVVEYARSKFGNRADGTF